MLREMDVERGCGEFSSVQTSMTGVPCVCSLLLNEDQAVSVCVLMLKHNRWMGLFFFRRAELFDQL